MHFKKSLLRVEKHLEERNPCDSPYSVPGNRDLPRAAISIVSDGRAVENNKEKRLVPEQIKKKKKKVVKVWHEKPLTACC